MKKRILSLFLALVVTFSMVCPLVFADDSSTHVHNWTSGVISEFSDTVEGIPVSVSVKKCTECNFYKHTYKFFGLSFDFYSVTAYTGIVEDFLLDVSLHIMNSLGKNASAKKYETGGGSAGTGGVGRHPNGYADDTGTPSVGANGELQFTVYPDLFVNNRAFWNGSDFHPYTETFSFSDAFGSVVVSNLRAVVRKMSNSSTAKYYLALRYKFNAPVSGLYYLNGEQLVCSGLYNSNGVLRSVYFGHDKLNRSVSAGSNLSISDSNGFAYSTIIYKDGSQIPDTYTVRFYPLVVTCVPNSSSVNQTNSITINNNTWNGNIYQDNSTNLTYIYPQYTTINENNETVTNISNNPIIYNNETKQYYTYDTVTNNYYYITYEAPTPSPSPDPDPTPTPTPGGDTGDTSGIMKILQEIKAVLVSDFAGITEKLQNIGVGGSTPETAQPGSSSGNKGQSWWDKLLGKIGDAIVDGLLGAISAVLKLIFKLFTTILGWIIWLVSQVLTLFPFLPPGLGALLIGGVVVCFIIGLIKFIRG